MPQGYSRIYCHQQPEAGQDQPVVCAVCYYNFFGPECTTNGKLIRTTPKPEVGETTPEPEVGESTKEPKIGESTQESEIEESTQTPEPKIMPDREFVPGGRTSLIEQDEPPKSNPEGRKTDNTSLLW